MKRYLLLLAAVIPVAAQADKLRMPADAPPSFQAECASCHVAFPPALLVADDWKRVMASLDKHYGDNASLDDKVRRELEDFLVRNAGAGKRVVGAGDPPRMTATGWFKREHRKVAEAVWKDKRVGSAANCAACHPRAEAGSYSEREIVIPGVGKFKER